MESNWQNKNIEELENDRWEEDHFDSHLVKKTFELRKAPLNKFSTEDLRIMISQQIGLIYLVPLAIEQLTGNLFVEGDYYEGDLLQSILSVDQLFWQSNKNLWLEMNELIRDSKFDLEEKGINATKFDPEFRRY